jgi:hypothetical protein
MTGAGGDAARLVMDVVRAALAECGAGALLLLEPDTAEARLLLRWARELGSGDRVLPAGPADAAADGEPGDAVVLLERARAEARLRARRERLLLAHPINRTALLLTPPPPEPVLPLGDLYAGQVLRMAGRCTLPDGLDVLAAGAGGVERLDDALRARLEARRTAAEAFADLPEPVRAEVEARLTAGRFWRRRVPLVPKLGWRTPGIDLFD